METNIKYFVANLNKHTTQYQQGAKGVMRDAWFEQKLACDTWKQLKYCRDPWICGLSVSRDFLILKTVIRDSVRKYSWKAKLN